MGLLDAQHSDANPCRDSTCHCQCLPSAPCRSTGLILRATVLQSFRDQNGGSFAKKPFSLVKEYSNIICLLFSTSQKNLTKSIVVKFSNYDLSNTLDF